MSWSLDFFPALALVWETLFCVLICSPAWEMESASVSYGSEKRSVMVQASIFWSSGFDVCGLEWDLGEIQGLFLTSCLTTVLPRLFIRRTRGAGITRITAASTVWTGKTTLNSSGG